MYLCELMRGSQAIWLWWPNGALSNEPNKFNLPNGVLNSNPFLNGENMPVLKYRSISYVNRFMLISGCYVRIERWAMLPLDPTWSCAQGGLKTLYRIPGRVVPACQIQTLLQTTVNLNLDIWLIYVLNWVTLAYFGITLAYFDCMLAWQF